MVWRSISAAIVLFWAVMTGLIIRDAYFPDSSRFAEVPPKFVFELFLNQAAAFNNSLHLYHEKEKTGHATFSLRRLPDKEGSPIYGLRSNGSFSSPGEGGKKADTAFQVSAELEDAKQWHRFEIETVDPTTHTTANVKWKRGDAFPEIEVAKNGTIIMNSQMAQALLALQGGAGNAGEWDWLVKQSGSSGMLEAMNLRAHEGLMDLAGRQRRCYIVSAGMPGMYEVKVFFTELGELARIELPQGYRLLEPMMHGMEPELNTVE